MSKSDPYFDDATEVRQVAWEARYRAKRCNSKATRQALNQVGKQMDELAASANALAEAAEIRAERRVFDNLRPAKPRRTCVRCKAHVKPGETLCDVCAKDSPTTQSGKIEVGQ